jgi:hypothetical protein
MTERLMIFTRYPQPGAAKTRLIPALGEVGAAAISRQMTEHTLAQVLALQQAYPVQAEIWFAGGTANLMRQWLGENWCYVAQGTGDLGDRLVRSCRSAFTSGCQRVVIIGTDCPELNSSLLAQAFSNLYQNDLVLGPAQDGGYYLIGLRQFVPELFAGVAWSTDAVLRQTQAIATQLGLTILLLPVLCDVDMPNDLALWERVSTAPNGQLDLTN